MAVVREVYAKVAPVKVPAVNPIVEPKKEPAPKAVVPTLPTGE